MKLNGVNKDMNRRDFLRLSGLTTAGVVLAACGGGGEPAAAPAAGEAAAGAETGAATASGLADVARERTLILMFGGAFLCYEGAHKIIHKLQGYDDKDHGAPAAMQGPEAEAKTISGAIRTDFILSAEIMVISS